MQKDKLKIENYFRFPLMLRQAALEAWRTSVGASPEASMEEILELVLRRDAPSGEDGGFKRFDNVS